MKIPGTTRVRSAEETYRRYGAGEYPDKDDRRQHNVDLLVEEVSGRIEQVKPWAKSGISPFGIWRNDSTDPRGSEPSGLPALMRMPAQRAPRTRFTTADEQDIPAVAKEAYVYATLGSLTLHVARSCSGTLPRRGTERNVRYANTPPGRRAHPTENGGSGVEERPRYRRGQDGRPSEAG